MYTGQTYSSPEDALAHYGVKGMRWGVRKSDRPATLTPSPTDTAVTKRVKKDYNELSDAAFKRKYAGSKEKYARRVEKHGDPYARRIQGRSGQLLKKADDKLQKKFAENPNYTKRMQDNDRRSVIFGKNKAVRNINADMNKGMTRKDAFEKEMARRNKIRGLVIGTAYLGYSLYTAGVVIDKNALAYNIGQRAEAKRGERRAQEFINSRGIPQQTRKPREASAKRSRRTGAYKITDL